MPDDTLSKNKPDTDELTRKKKAAGEEAGADKTDPAMPRLDEASLAQLLKKPEGLLSGEWLQTMSDQELVVTMIAMVLELQSRVGKPSMSTETIALDVSPFSFTTDREDLKVDPDRFLRLPATPAGEQTEKDGYTWRCILVSSNAKHKLLGLEIHDDVVVGRLSEGDPPPDLDLSDYGAESAGVSRRHAILRPTEDSLLLIDQDSSNGTYRNQTRLRPGTAHRTNDEDIISFGNLHFKLMIVEKPKQSPSK